MQVIYYSFYERLFGANHNQIDLVNTYHLSNSGEIRKADR